MPEQELNKYYEQARRATLAQIAGNQEQLVQSQQQSLPMAQVMRASEELNAPLPAGPAIPQGQAQVQAPAGLYQDRGLEAMPGGPELPAGQAVMQAQEQPVGLDDWMAGMEEERARRSRELEMAQILDPRAQRAENSRKWIAGIGDALASMANMVGTGNDAANQPQTYMLPGVNAAVEQDRARRTAAYQKQVDRINQIILQQAKDAAADARQQRQIDAADKRAAADREARARQNETANKLARDKFESDKAKQEAADKLAARRQEETERHNKVAEQQGWSRIAKMKDNNNPGAGDGEGGNGGGRFSGRKGGGIKDAKTDYNAMLDEIAERNGCVDWADLTNRARNDRTLRGVYNQFDLSKEKAGSAKIEGMISHYAKDYAPEFHSYYFGGGVDDKVDFSGYKPAAQQSTATSGGTLADIMSSGQDNGKRKKKNK